MFSDIKGKPKEFFEEYNKFTVYKDFHDTLLDPKMKRFIILALFLGLQRRVYTHPSVNYEFAQDADIQEALIGISRRLPRECAIAMIYDEQMPVYSVSQLIERMQSHERMFIMLNISPNQLPNLGLSYGSNSTDPIEIIHTVLHALYRKRRCYIFHVWVKDPRILYPDTNVNHHPGWRKSDYVILVVPHITKRITLINLRIWNQIPNVVGLKRNKLEFAGLAVNIFTVYPYFRNGRRKSQEMDVYLVKEKKFLKNNALFPEKFDNLHNSTLTLGILWKEPFFIWGNKKDPWLDGLDWRLFMLCRDELNFTFAVVNIITIGKKVDGGWTGMLALLSNGTIDVGVGGVSVTPERRTSFDFCRTYYTDSYNFIAPLNSRFSSALNTFSAPLSNDVWLGTFITVGIGILTLKVVALIEKHYMKNGLDSHFNSISNNCGFVVTIFCQKPYRHLPQTSALQSVYLGMTIMTFLLGMAFSSCLISVLLGFKPKPIADKVSDILKTNLPISIRNYDGHLNEYMNRSGIPEIRQIFQKGKLVDYYQSSEAMDQVVKGKMIYIDSLAKIQFSGKYRYAAGPVGLKFHVSSGSILEFDNLGWPVDKNWPLMPKFDDIISRAVESGLVQYWMSQFRRGRFGHSSEAWEIPESLITLMDKVDAVPEIKINPDYGGGNKFVKLTSEHVTGVVILYMVGVTISGFVFLTECVTGIIIAIYKHGRKKCNKNPKSKASIVIVKPSDSADIPQKPIQVKIDHQTKKLAKKQSSKFLRCKKIKKKDEMQTFPELVWDDFKRTQIYLKKVA